MATKTTNIKKKIGEKAFQFLSKNFNESFLKENLKNIFFDIKEIRLIDESEFFKIKMLLNEAQTEPKQEKTVVKTARELLAEAGYDLFDNLNCEKDYLIFKKYYKDSEALCKFKSYDATERFDKLFFIIKKNINEIKRENFPLPKRQDGYSTSCMSVGIRNNNVMQITSRYNHAVTGCDNTFNSNLDSIVEGLTESFNQDYQLSIKKNREMEINNFYSYNNKLYHYFYEIDGKKIGNNTVDGLYYNPDQYLIIEHFIIDLKNKSIKNILNNTDGFIEYFNKKIAEGANIVIRKGDIPDNFKDDKNINIFL